MRRRQLTPADVSREVTRGTIGWWVKTYFKEYRSTPITEVWFLTRRSADRYARRLS